MEAAAKFPVKLSFERSVTNGNVFAGEHFKNIFKYTFSVCFCRTSGEYFIEAVPGKVGTDIGIGA